ncbi:MULTISPECIES: ferrous iron transport protein B [unclassified Ruminococcus]|uniref:ferrous iron transport protein B n=1 Tax=unclassified Ruminococcus TaxID=2608920 RepID=UPI00210BB142|nr:MULTISPECIES: ferrous iron transport protein B [unclassified Ruminococcus]
MTNNQYTVAFAGNPNVGKSTVFNNLTGLNQHTGNWTGKTVSNAFGCMRYKNITYTLVDLPGTYSLLSSSKEETVARDYICFEHPQLVVVVIDATCIERNLNLVMQILEITDRVIVCVNLMDEARKKSISVNIKELSSLLGVPVVESSARSGKGMSELKEMIYKMTVNEKKTYVENIKYNKKIENEAEKNYKKIRSHCISNREARFYSLRLLENDEEFNLCLERQLGMKLYDNAVHRASYRDEIAQTIVKKAEEIFLKTVTFNRNDYNKSDRRLDKLFTSKLTGIPIMLLMLGIIFWITIVGANYPSQWLSSLFGNINEWLRSGLNYINSPAFLTSLICDGIFKTTSWVVSVMLPPMAIFFPLFTILEDFGYLPRVAFNLDKYFKKSGAHGKQSLSMCMGFGCNACGVTGCRIIDSPRERLIAILTNAFVPCNGRFPALIALITIFLTAPIIMPFQSVFSAIILLGFIVLSVLMTMAMSKLLSVTLLKGESSSFVLELPPYRVPQVGKVIVRSVMDRILFVLWRAVVVAVPAGMIIWLLANISVGGNSLLNHFTSSLDGFAHIFGLDGVILAAFILGFPANEIVIPIMIMAYTANSSLTEYESLLELHSLFTANGWTVVTAICVIVFLLFHFPCSTTCITIFKETKSLKWTALAFLLPTSIGLLLCMIISSLARIIMYAV